MWQVLLSNWLMQVRFRVEGVEARRRLDSPFNYSVGEMYRLSGINSVHRNRLETHDLSASIAGVAWAHVWLRD